MRAIPIAGLLLSLALAGALMWQSPQTGSTAGVTAAASDAGSLDGVGARPNGLAVPEGAWQSARLQADPQEGVEVYEIEPQSASVTSEGPAQVNLLDTPPEG